jgi:superfamily II DNA or RNA helicase
VEPGSTQLRPASRDTALREIASHNKSVLFHYDTISEGINVPNLTDVMFLRGSLNRETLIQGIGRVLRAALGKTCGYVWVATFSDSDTELLDRFKTYIYCMRQADHQFVVNDLFTIYNGMRTNQAWEGGGDGSSFDPNSVATAALIAQAAANIYAEEAYHDAMRQARSIPMMSDEEFEKIMRELEFDGVTPEPVELRCSMCGLDYPAAAPKCPRHKSKQSLAAHKAHATRRKNKLKLQRKCADEC